MTIQRMFEPRRELGRTGFKATVLGIGDVADRAVPMEDCVVTVRRAMDAGLNVVDTAPMYENGYSEEIVGRAVREHLRQGGSGGRRREELFVIDKIDFYDQPVAAQVDKSLGLLGMDGVDLFVFHGLSDLAVWRKVAGPGGMMEELGACVKAGKTRFRGISSHHPDVLREAIESGLCDVVMFAVGAFTDIRYAEEIVPLARERGVGTVCFKTFGAGRLLGGAPEANRGMHIRPRGKLSSGGVSGGAGSATAVLEGDDPAARLTIEECVHFTLTCDPDVALLGMSFPNEQEAAFAAARSFKALPPAKVAAIRAKAAGIMAGQPAWWNPQK